MLVFIVWVVVDEVTYWCHFPIAGTSWSFPESKTKEKHIWIIELKLIIK